MNAAARLGVWWEADMTPAVRPLAVGDLIRSNDPRMAGCMNHEVFTIGDYRALARQPSGEVVCVALSRIHLDGKPRRSGWSRVTA